MNVRCKLCLTEITKLAWSPTAVKMKFTAVYDSTPVPEVAKAA